jgi:NAD(P)H dehydrogenase (quinone)
MTQILVTGATGGLGNQVVEFLLRRVPGGNIVALARDPATLHAFAEKGVQVRAGDYLDPASLERAFSGVDKLLLVSARAFTDAVTQHSNVIGAAKRVGVRHLHYISLQHVEGSTHGGSPSGDAMAKRNGGAVARLGARRDAPAQHHVFGHVAVR